MINNYSFGTLTIDNQTYTSDLIIYADGTVEANWWRKKGHRLNADDIRNLIATKPDTIIAGKGVSGLMRPEKALIQLLTEQRIEFIAQKNSSALKTYNELSPHKKVGACFHLTC
jgi:hypothetical protein